jgi:hypothetical protein
MGRPDGLNQNTDFTARRKSARLAPHFELLSRLMEFSLEVGQLSK